MLLSPPLVRSAFTGLLSRHVPCPTFYKHHVLHSEARSELIHSDATDRARRMLVDRAGQKTWRRMQYLVDLAVRHNNQSRGGIVDVGTDHGLLAVAFALTGTFDRVLGVDVSERALQDGALRLQKEIEDYPGEKEVLAPLDFRVSDGLHAVTVGEADTVCIAGMGVNTMIDILTAENDRQEPLLDALQSKSLIVQPTNSRPRNLLLLYSALKEMGWNPKDERIEYLSSRWYLSTLFTGSGQGKTKDTGMLLPGALLAGLNDEDRVMRNVFSGYVEHHCTWIERDKKIPGGKVSEGDELWLENFSNYSKRRELEK